MNILIAGRLGRYADRILTLQQLGHRLVLCTMPAPRQSPLPDDLGDAAVPQYVLRPGTAGARVAEIVRDHHIDVVYSMKNVWDGSLELLGEVLDAGIGPVVRHYKEHFCEPSDLERRSLLETAGQIYINAESLSYFRQTYDVRRSTAHILDTDYLPARYMTDELRPKLSERDGEPHLLVAGGVSATGGRNDVRELCEAMARRRVHVHIYGGKFVGPNAEGVWRVGDETARNMYERLTRTGYLHLHPHVEPAFFTAAWSVYDAGLMHVRAGGTTHDSGFQSMNRPNRMSPYLAAGLPLAQQNRGQQAMERLVRESGIGFLYGDYDELADALHDRRLLAGISRQVRAQRSTHTFEHHAEELAGILARYANA